MNSKQVKEYKKGYYQKNKAKLLKGMRNYQKENEEKIRKDKKTYYRENKKQLNEKMKNWREENTEYTKEYYKKNKEYYNNYSKNYHKNNREKISKLANEYQKQRKKTDKEFKILCRTRNRLREALEDYSKNGKVKKSKDYFINYEKIIEHLKPLPQDLENYDIHHIIPLFTFDFNDKEQIKQAFSPQNHQLLLKSIHHKLNHRRLKNDK